MVGKSEPARFSLNLSPDTNRWCYLMPNTNVRYIGTQCQDTKPAKSLLKSADARKFDNKQLARDRVPSFSLPPKQHKSCTYAMVTAALHLVAISIAKEGPGLGKKGSWDQAGMYLKMEGEPSASG